MAVFVLDSATVLVGVAWTGATAPGGTAAAVGTITTPTDVSGFLTEVALEVSLDEHDATTFTSGGWRRNVPGLAKGTVALGGLQDFAAAQLDALFGLGGTFGLSVGAAAATTLYMDIKPTSAAHGSTNPSYVLKWWNLGYRLVGGSVGELAVSGSLSFPTDGRVETRRLMREADARRLAEIKADNPDITAAELRDYADRLALIPDEVRTKVVVSCAV